MQTKPVSSILLSHTRLESAEAIALVQELIATSMRRHADRDAAPIRIEDLSLGEDGTLLGAEHAVELTAFAAGTLLDALLSRGGVTRMPGALRYVIARALGVVEAPPYPALDALSAALERFERGPRQEVLRGLFARAATVGDAAEERLGPAAGAMTAEIAGEASPNRAVGERRRAALSTAELRRQLREADAALFTQSWRDDDQFAEPAIPPAAPIPSAPARRRIALALVAAAAIVLAFGAGYVVVDRQRQANDDRRLPGQPEPAAHLATSAAVSGSPTVAQTAQPMAPRTARPQETPSSAAPATAASISPQSPPPLSRTSRPQPSGEPPQRLDRQPAMASRDAGPTRVKGLATDAAPAFSPSFANDGTALFFHAGRSSDAHSALEEAPLVGDDLRVMTILDDGAKNYHVQPSPDGARVAFDSDRDGQRGVYIANRDGTDVQRVSGPGYAAVPTWSPDGTRIAFIRGESAREQVWNLWLLDLKSTATTRLTAFPYGQTWSASWFPDGRRIAYTHEDRLFIRDLNRGETQEFASPLERRLVRTPAVSPDGHFVIFQVARSGAWLLDLRDGSMRCVLTDPTAEEFAWAPDGRRVAFHSRRDGQWGIWQMAR